jgi:hypothetical protein
MVFNFGFNDVGDICEIAVKLGNTIIQKIELPMMIARMQMAQIIQEIAYDSRPMQVKCSVPCFSESGRELEDSITFENQAYKNAFGGKEENV